MADFFIPLGAARFFFKSRDVIQSKIIDGYNHLAMGKDHKRFGQNTSDIYSKNACYREAITQFNNAIISFKTADDLEQKLTFKSKKRKATAGFGELYSYFEKIDTHLRLGEDSIAKNCLTSDRIKNSYERASLHSKFEEKLSKLSDSYKVLGERSNSEIKFLE